MFRAYKEVQYPLIQCFKGIRFNSSPSMTKQSNSTAVNAFNLNHKNYSALRPNFTKEVVNPFLVSLGLADYNEDAKTYSFHTEKKVLELAAGTGKFTERLVENGWGVKSDNLFIVEPSEGMLQSFKTNLPQVNPANVFNGSSYKIPLADNSVDVVFIAQGFHWFADIESLKEMYRVLKPQGKLGLIWNFDGPSPSQNSDTSKVQYINENSEYFDKIDFKNAKTRQDAFASYFANQQWNGKITDLMYAKDVVVPQYRRAVWREVLASKADVYFKPASEEIFGIHESLIEREDVYKYWETRSYITSLNDKEKSELKKDVDVILSKYVDENSTHKGDSRLIKPMAVHAVVVPVNK